MIDLMLLIGGAVAWYAVGCYCFVYWWTSEFDLKSSNLLLMLFAGLTGPIAYLMGWSVHGVADSKTEKVLLKKR